VTLSTQDLDYMVTQVYKVSLPWKQTTKTEYIFTIGRSVILQY